jgi:chromosome partitioning protein
VSAPRTLDRSTDTAATGGAVRRGRVTTIANLKGGVSKTTNVVNMACGLARGVSEAGSARFRIPPQRTLVIDFESLSTLSTWLGVAAADPFSSVAVLFEERPETMGEADWEARLLALALPAAHEPIDVIPADLAGVQTTDGAQGKSEFAFSDNLEILRRHYDQIIIDTPGQAQNRMLKSALIASDGVIIPMPPTGVVMMSIQPLFTLIRDIKRAANRDLAVDGWLISNAGHSNDRDALELRRNLRETSKVHTFDSAIRSLKSIARSSLSGCSVFGTDGAEDAVRDYTRFLLEWWPRAGGAR